MSAPKGSAGSTSRNVPSVPGRIKTAKFRTRSIVLPIIVLTLGSLFFVYSRTSIQAAKENAKRAREADGGTINWRNENLRRHGALERPAERTLWQQLINGNGDADQATKERREKENKRLDLEARRMRQSNPIEEGIRRAREGGGSSGNGS